MIRYSLKCSADHHFQTWFPSAQGYEDQHARGFVQCPDCGSALVEKTLMAPMLRTGRKAVADRPAEPTGPLSTPADDRERALTDLRRAVEKNSEYVGMNFVTEARRIHAGDAPERSIHGEAKADEARQLIEDGVPVAPLPFLPTRKAN
jgi:hypothetical protein